MVDDPVNKHIRHYPIFLSGGRFEQRLSVPEFDHTKLPASPDDYSLFFAKDRQTVTWWDGEAWEFPNFVADVLTESVTVSGTTTKTTVWQPDVDTGSLIDGRVYQIDLMGKFSTANTSSRFTVDVDIAGTDVAGIQNAGANVNEAPFSVEFTFTVRSEGENGEIHPHTRGLFNSNSADATHETITVDTTTSTDINVTFEWNDGSAGNSATLEQAHLKQMG